MLTFLAEARRGPTRRPLLAFSSQDLRPGPRPARHLDFHSPDALSLRCRLPQERLAIDSVLPVVGWESTERLECNCVREIGLGNKHGRSIEAMHSFPLPLELDTKLSAPRKTGRAVQRDVTSISLRRIDRACYQD